MLLFYKDTIETPLGEFLIISDQQGRLRGANWVEFTASLQAQLAKFHVALPIFEQKQDAGGFSSAFSAYFSGKLNALDKLPFYVEGTDFQKKVWQSLREISCGETITYAQLASNVNNPKACRAVGSANGQNPISIAIPCHRVIANGGKFGGYAGGIERKIWLLQHEAAL